MKVRVLKKNNDDDDENEDDDQDALSASVASLEKVQTQNEILNKELVRQRSHRNAEFSHLRQALDSQDKEIERLRSQLEAKREEDDDLVIIDDGKLELEEARLRNLQKDQQIEEMFQRINTLEEERALALQRHTELSSLWNEMADQKEKELERTMEIEARALAKHREVENLQLKLRATDESMAQQQAEMDRLQGNKKCVIA